MTELEVTVEDLDNACRTTSELDGKYGRDTNETVCSTCVVAEALKRTGLVDKPYVSSLPWKVCSKEWNSRPVYRIDDDHAWLPVNFDMARHDDGLLETLRQSLPVTIVLSRP